MGFGLHQFFHIWVNQIRPQDKLNIYFKAGNSKYKVLWYLELEATHDVGSILQIKSYLV